MKVILSFVLLTSLVHCSPERRIEIQNKSNAEAHVIWTLKEDSAKTSPLFISNNTELRFDLKNTHPYNHVKMSYGIGKWNMNFINDLASDLESLEIQSTNENTKLTNLDDIKNYLLQHRKGFGKTKLKIILN